MPVPVDKIRPFHDPRIQLRSANLNGYTYGYLYSPASTKVPKQGTIVLIHGFPDISWGWRYQIPFLTSLGLDVIAPDCMGYGRTDAPIPLADYTYRRISDDIAELCRQQGLTQIILGGHDWGGAIVYRVAQYYPTLIHSLFSICTPFYAPNPNYEPLALQVRTRLPNFGYQLHFASGQIEAACQSPSEIRQFLANLYGARTPDGKVAFSAEKGIALDLQRTMTARPKHLDAAELDLYTREFSRHGLRGPLNWYRNRELNYLDEWDYFFDTGANTSARPTVNQDVLYVMAKKDLAIRPFMAAKIAERLPNLTRKEVDCGHWALWERPEECNQHIGAWLKDVVFPKLNAKKNEKSRL